MGRNREARPFGGSGVNVEDVCHEIVAFLLLPIWLVLCALESRGYIKQSMWPEADMFYRSWKYP
jgi:hypothetical protein